MVVGRVLFILSLALLVLVVFVIVEVSDVEIQNVGTLYWFGHHNLGLAAGVTALWTIGSGIILKGRVRRNRPLGRLRYGHIALTSASVGFSAMAWLAGLTIMSQSVGDTLHMAHGVVGLLLVIFGILSIVSAPCVSRLVGQREVHSNLVSIYIALAVLQVMLGFGRII